MDDLLVGAGTALWLGILTSISPCPLATNIAAISFIGKQIGNPRRILLSAILYVAGRMITYLLLGVLLVASILSIPEISNFLQKYMNRLLGPILILVGMFLLGLINIGSFGFGANAKMQARAGAYGIWGAGLLGIIFALSFCPVSAALFFGTLIPISMKYDSRFLLPSLYGIGTGLPVILVGVLISYGTHLAGKALDRLAEIEKWARLLTGIIFILAGFYYALQYIFGVQIYR